MLHVSSWRLHAQHGGVHACVRLGLLNIPTHQACGMLMAYFRSSETSNGKAGVHMAHLTTRRFRGFWGWYHWWVLFLSHCLHYLTGISDHTDAINKTISGMSSRFVLGNCGWCREPATYAIATISWYETAGQHSRRCGLATRQTGAQMEGKFKPGRRIQLNEGWFD
jgi:hypothetical protein